MQGVKHFKDIRYTPTLTYGEMLLQNEYEMSCYNLDNAHVPSQQQLFELHQQVFLAGQLVSMSICIIERPKYMKTDARHGKGAASSCVITLAMTIPLVLSLHPTLSRHSA